MYASFERTKIVNSSGKIVTKSIEDDQPETGDSIEQVEVVKISKASVEVVKTEVAKKDDDIEAAEKVPNSPVVVAAQTDAEEVNEAASRYVFIKSRGDRAAQNKRRRQKRQEEKAAKRMRTSAVDKAADSIIGE